jgi:hypothetical protein
VAVPPSEAVDAGRRAAGLEVAITDIDYLDAEF